MSDDARSDGWIDYAYDCMDQAGWLSVECENCGSPRLFKSKEGLLMACEECGEAETEVGKVRAAAPAPERNPEDNEDRDQRLVPDAGCYVGGIVLLMGLCGLVAVGTGVVRMMAGGV